MKVDITEMLIFFDELLSLSDEERGIYWFKTRRPDGICITFIFSLREEDADIIVRRENIDMVGLSLKKCSEIRVLDPERKCLEILHESGQGRCFLSLLGDSILDYTE